MSRHATPWRKPRAQRLGARLLSGISLGITGNAIDMAITAAALEIGVNPPAEPLAPALQRALQPADVQQVSANTENHSLDLAAWPIKSRPPRRQCDHPSAPAYARCSPRAEKDRLADQEVTDVEFDDFLHGGDRARRFHS